MMLHKKIIEYHGRIENVKVFNKDPTPYIQAAEEKKAERAKALKAALEKQKELEESGEQEESKEPVAAAAAA